MTRCDAMRAGLVLLPALLFVTVSFGGGARAAGSNYGRYVEAVRRFADTCIEHGRDAYGPRHTPLFADGLHATTLEPPRWKGPKSEWILSNYASQQPLVRLLEGLTKLTGEGKYSSAAEEAARYALEHLCAPNGLLYWGGHAAWDLEHDGPAGEYDARIHEMKNHQPHYRLMWRVNPAATRKLLQAIWAAHIVDWSKLDYNRHGKTDRPIRLKWDSPFDEDIEVPFPARGGNLSFVNTSIPLMRTAVMLAVLGEDASALTWARRLVYRWQQARDPKTGLSGGQVSYREKDRAKEALGHVHPNINEAKIVASYHSTGRYRSLPLAQMQAGELLVAAGGPCAGVGREFIRWASDDLKVYARHCYDRATGKFVAAMTDGTRMQWEKTRDGYYNARSFAPIGPSGFNLWGYAMAFRLTGEADHWEMVRELGKRLGVGDFGRPDGRGRSLRLKTDRADWRVIYALLELHEAARDPAVLRLACRVADNILKGQAATGLFPRRGYEHARTGDEIPLAVLHLAAALAGRRSQMPPPALDSRFLHCRYHGELKSGQKKRGDARTYDNNVFFGR